VASNPISFNDPFGLECNQRGNCTQADVSKKDVETVQRRAYFTDPATRPDYRCVLDCRVLTALAEEAAPFLVGLAADRFIGSPPRIAAGQGARPRLTSSQAAELAEYNGYPTRVKDAPFNSHGQPVFSNGKNYITPDVDGHSGGVWKMFSGRGRRLGTFDELLQKLIGP
jgi:hypothetical protein